MVYNCHITTNIDQYNTKQCFPVLPVVPRIGESVRVLPSFESFYVSDGLPAILEVVSVEYRELFAVAHVHYRTIDIQKAQLAGTTSNLYK